MLHLNISESRCSFFPSLKVLNLHNTERPLYQCCTHCVIFSTLGPNQSFDVAASRATSTPTYSLRVLQTSTKGKDFTSCILHMLSSVKACTIVNWTLWTFDGLQDATAICWVCSTHITAETLVLKRSIYRCPELMSHNCNTGRSIFLDPTLPGFHQNYVPWLKMKWSSQRQPVSTGKHTKTWILSNTGCCQLLKLFWRVIRMNLHISLNVSGELCNYVKPWVCAIDWAHNCLCIWEVGACFQLQWNGRSPRWMQPL